MRIIWLQLARQDLEDIQAYYSDIAGKVVAEKIIRKIVKASRLLGDNPYIGHVSSLDSSGVTLEWVVPNTNYILPYAVLDDEIQIYRVFDTRQDPVDSWDA